MATPPVGRAPDGRALYAGSGGLASGQVFVRSAGDSANGRAVVLVDVAKLDAALSGDTGFYVGPGGTGAAIGSRYPEAQRFLARAAAENIPVEMTRVYVDPEGRVSISDGRHRFAALRDSGATVVPVAVDRSAAGRLKARYGAPTPAPRTPTAPRTPPVGTPIRPLARGSLAVRGGVHALVPLPTPTAAAPLARVVPANDGGLPVLDAALRSTRLGTAFAEHRLTAPQADRLGRLIAARGKAAARLATRDLVDGKTTLAAWRARMKTEVTRHAAAAARARLGTRNLPAADRRALEDALLEQLGYLDRFAAGLADGSIPRDARAVARAGLYGAGAWATAEAVAAGRAVRQGMDQERSVLGVADHCAGCVAEAARGWVGIGSLVPIGERDCLSNCRCRIEFRKAPTTVAAARREAVAGPAPAPIPGPEPLEFTSPQAATDWTNRHFADWSASLAPGERPALDDYSGFGYRNINALLRGTYSPRDVEIRAELLDQVGKIDSAIAKGSIPEPVVLWRGGAPASFADVKPGEALPTDPAYLSTSLLRSKAEGFAHGTRTLVKIEAPAGTPAAAVSRATGGHEQEFLLPRDSRLVVTGTETGPDGKTVISARWESASPGPLPTP